MTDNGVSSGLTSRACERYHPLLGSAPVADRVRRMPMTDDEMRVRALAVWRSIDTEADASARETRVKAQRLWYLGRDLRDAHRLRVSLRSAFAVVRYLMAVIHRSWGMGFAR